MKCPYCNSTEFTGKGYRDTKGGRVNRFYCKPCKKSFSEKTESINSDKDHVKQEYNKNDGMVESKSSVIKTVDDLLRYAEVDLSIWEVERYVVNKWEIGAKDQNGEIVSKPLYQIKAWLKRKEKDLSTEVSTIIKDMKAYAPTYPKIKYNNHKNSYLYEISVFDLHLAQLAWGVETGEDYDLKIAKKLYIDTVTELMSLVKGYPIEKILLPTGNDFFDIDTLDNETVHDTRQDVDSRWQKAFHESREMLVSVIDVLSTIAPVVVPIIQGNHDWQRTYYLGEVLSAWYDKSSNVSIDNMPRPRKYFHYGNNLIGYTHGNEEKIADLPLIMAREQSELWGQTKYQEWHIGHTHKSKKLNYVAGDTFNGVKVRVISSLVATDAWHFKKGYVKNIRAAESFLWDYNRGLIGNFLSPIT